MEDNKKMQQLVDTLNLYAYHYYVLDEPIASDQEYDRLYDQLLRLENESGIRLPDSPTQKIGGEIVQKFRPHTHINKLYSLDKCNSYDELREWDAKLRKKHPDISYTLEYKFDGLTLCLTYNKGLLVTASTRGNGTTGEDVTEQVKTIRSVPHRIEFLGLLEVQGEGIMRLSDFYSYNKTAKEPLKNPRNGVAGAVRNLDTRVTRQRKIDVLFYNVNYAEGTRLSSQEEINKFLKSNKFKTERLTLTSDIEKIITEINSIDKSKLDFVIDGMVIKINEQDVRDRLGYTDKFPRWAIAYKFEAEEATTKVLDVVWNVGRTGKLTPLAILEPVEIAGATVRRATLNNYGDILRKKVKLGSVVFIRRSNDVIPEILGVAREENTSPIAKPDVCPSCGSKIVEEGAHIFCPNYFDCPPQIVGRLEHFVSKPCMNIEGISTQTLEQLFDRGYVRDICDLYLVTGDQLAELDGFKEKKIANFLASVKSSKNVALSSFINALGIPGVGKKTASDLARIYTNMDNLMSATAEELSQIDEIGDIIAENIVEFFASHGSLVQRFRQIGISPTAITKAKTDGAFVGKKVVLTGKLVSYTREQAKSLIEAEGGEVVDSVSKETDIVLVGEKAGSKLEKAKKLSKQIMYEQEFEQIVQKQLD